MTERRRVTRDFEASLDKLSSLPARERRSVGPYRDPRDALIARRRALETDLRLAERVSARAERVRKYLPVLDAELREATAPFVDAIAEETPCRERWEDMEGDAATRRCARCDRDVYDLSKMTRDEIAALFAREAGELRRRVDGRVVSGDCKTATAARGWRTLTAAALVALLGGALYVAGAPATPASDAKRADAGKVSMDRPPEIRATGPETWEVDGTSIRRALDHPEHPSSVRIVPHVEEGRTVGVKLYGIRRDSLLHALGIRSGDLLLSVDGIPLTSPDHALEIHSRLRARLHVADAVVVRLVRSGQKRTHRYWIVR